MAKVKISALTPLGAAPASDDLIPVVDVDDPTQAASGTTKRVTVGELGAAGTAAHTADALDAHDASAVSLAAVAGLAPATPDVQAGFAALPGTFASLASLAWFDPMNYGATGAGVVDDTVAIVATAAAAHAAGGGRVLIGGNKTYLLSSPALSNLTNVYFVGGGTLKRKASGGSPDNTYVVNVQNCTDGGFLGVRFDVNNIERFGGVNIGGVSNYHLEDCKLFDSNLQATWATYDHFGFVIQASSDVWVLRNYAVDVELVEADNNDRVWIEDNVSLRAAGSASIALAAVGSGYYFRDYSIRRNFIVDPRKVGIYMLLEAGGLDNNEFRRIFVTDNVIDHRTIAGTARSIVLGNVTGLASTGNVYDDVRIEDNSVHCAAGLDRTGLNEIALIHTQAGAFKRCKVNRNQILHESATVTGAALLRVDKIVDGAVNGNRVFGINDVGMTVDALTNTDVLDNFAEATGAAFSFASSAGGNRLNGNRKRTGTFSVTLHATDLRGPTDDGAFSMDNLPTFYAGLTAKAGRALSAKVTLDWSGSTARLNFSNGGSGDVFEIGAATATSGGIKLGRAATEKIGFFGAMPGARPAAYTQTYSTADRTLGAYTSDPESSAYTGAADAEAKLADLNALRVAYENLRAFTEDLAAHHNALLDDLQTLGLLA